MKKTLLALLLAVFAAAAVSGCAKKDAPASAVPAGGNVAASSAAGLSSATAPSSSGSSSSGGTYSAAPAESASSQNGPVIDIQTDSRQFDAKFKQNPIDKSYIAESAAAVSNVDMVNVSNKYAGIWQKEIDHAWSALQKYQYPNTVKTEQQKWENGKAAALRKISEDAQSAGGTMAQVDAASQTMDFYRSRANQLYRALYAYNKNYSYAFQSK